MDCKNSSGKIFSNVEIKDNKIIVKHQTKPLLEIENKEIIDMILNKDNQGMIILFDDFGLCIGEIAALYGLPYSTTNKIMKSLPLKTGARQGRRNSSYGQTFSDERKKKIGEKSKGRIIPQYERTPEIRKKISDSLKEYYKENEVSQETREKLSQAWADGKYNNAKMGRGIQGYFYSSKNDRDIYFRSLLELSFLLIIEENEQVRVYNFEPFSIKIGNNHHYTPDCLINNKVLIELKPEKHLNYESSERFNQEIKAATAYCEENNLVFKVIYDKDINFNSRRFKTFIKFNPDIISQYNIRFKTDINDWS